MPYPGLLHPEPPPLRQATVDRTSAGDTQTQFWLSLCGVSGSWCTQGLFETSERLWREWGLILNVNLPLPLSCWGFSFALGCGVLPHGRSSKAQPLLLTLDVGYLLTATAPNFGHGVSPHSRHSWPWTFYIPYFTPFFYIPNISTWYIVRLQNIGGTEKKKGQFEVLVLILTKVTDSNA